MNSFHVSLSELWKSQTSPGELEDIFQVFITNNLAIGGIKDVDPVFDAPSAISEQGILELSGYYPTAPSQVWFELGYIYERSEWKLVGIQVNLTEEPR